MACGIPGHVRRPPPPRAGERRYLRHRFIRDIVFSAPLLFLSVKLFYLRNRFHRRNCLLCLLRDLSHADRPTHSAILAIQQQVWGLPQAFRDGERKGMDVPSSEPLEPSCSCPGCSYPGRSYPGRSTEFRPCSGRRPCGRVPHLRHPAAPVRRCLERSPCARRGWAHRNHVKSRYVVIGRRRRPLRAVSQS